MATMKAVYIEQPTKLEDLKLTDLPKPLAGPNQVLIKIELAGFNSYEEGIITGALDHYPLPTKLGSEGAGTIEKVGEGVQGLNVGDNVLIGGRQVGSYAQYIALDYRKVLPLPKGIPLQDAFAYAGMFITAYYALKVRTTATAGETILVQGAGGPAGNAMVQLARASGLRVLATAGTTEGLELAKKAGAQEVFNYRDKNYMDKIKEAAGTRGVDLVYEVNVEHNFHQDLQILNQKGRLLIIGGFGLPKGDTPTDLILVKDLSVLGVSVYTYLDDLTQADVRELISMIQTGFELGWAWPVIDKSFPLRDLGKAAKYANTRTGNKGKVLITIEH